MTEKNKSTHSGDDLDDAWVRAGGDGGSSQFGAVDSGGHYSSAVDPEETRGVNDAEMIDITHAAVKKGKSWISYLIIGVGGLVGIGALAGIGLFISNMFTAGDVQVKKADIQTLPDVKDSTSSIPGATDPSIEPQIAPGSAQVAALDVPQASSPSSASTPAPSASVAEVKGTSAVQPTVQSTGTTMQGGGQATGSAPVVSMKGPPMQPKADPYSVGHAMQAGNRSDDATASPAGEPVKPKSKQEHKAMASRAHEKVANVPDGGQKKRSTHQVAKRTSKKSEKAGSNKEAAQSDAVASSVSSNSTKVLKGFVIISIWPKTGNFQQAALKDAAGKNYIVHTGDSLIGYRVLNINADQHVVTTDAGEIR